METVSTTPGVWSVVWSLMPHSFVAGAAILVGLAFGVREAAYAGRLPVRLLQWWIDRFVRPLIASRSWLWRTLAIACNNSAICAAMVAVGYFGHLTWLILATVGFSLGIAINLLASDRDEVPGTPPEISSSAAFLALVGMLLNMLEIPAILISGGLGLAQHALWPELTFEQAAAVFVAVPLPMLLTAAGGESTWMAVYWLTSRSDAGEGDDSPPDEDHGEGEDGPESG